MAWPSWLPGLCFAALILGTTPGCYYAHLASGQLRLLAAREPVDEVLADSETPQRLREQLELVQEVRAFADTLGLRVDGQYTSYVAWPGDRVITTVVATRPGEVEAAGFHFPIVGTLPYKGYFQLAHAEREAERLKAKGMDVCVLAVDAYSTLGWLDDPITAPMLERSDGEVAETVLHELVHATVFVESDPDFNEGVAQFVGEEALIRFYANDAVRQDRERRRIDDHRRVAGVMLELRDQVADLYAEPLMEGDIGARTARTQRRKELTEATRAKLAALDLGSYDALELSQSARLNDACLAIRGTYAGDTALHEELLARLHDDLPRFVEQLREVAERDDPRTDFFGP